MMVPYHEITRLIRAGGELLNLPSRTICTALVFCHRFAHASSNRDHLGLDAERLATTCLFLASKVEEASLRTNDLLNAVRYLHRQPAHPWKQAEAGSVAVGQQQQAAGSAMGAATAGGSLNAAGTVGRRGSGQPPPPPHSNHGQQQQQQQQQEHPAHQGEQPVAPAAEADPEMLVGDRYYAAKSQLIHDEQVLLRLLRFDIGVDQPHKYLYCLARTVRAEGGVVRLATCILNDCLVYLDACITQAPEVLAAAALQVAAGLAQVPLPRPQQGSCWEVLGLDAQRVAAACRAIEGMLAQARR